MSPSTLSVSVRPFTSTDVNRVLEIRNSTLLEMIDEDNYPKDVICDLIDSLAREKLLSLAEQENYTIHVAEDPDCHPKPRLKLL